jgi:hypothetical protein
MYIDLGSWNAEFIYRTYREVPAKLVGNAPWVNLSGKNQTYTSPKLNSYRDKDKRSYKESEFLCCVESMSGNFMTCCDEVPHYSWRVREYLHQFFSKLLDRSRWTPDMVTDVARPYPSRLLSLGPLEELSVQNKGWHKTCTALSYFLQWQSTYRITLRLLLNCPVTTDVCWEVHRIWRRTLNNYSDFVLCTWYFGC